MQLHPTQSGDITGRPASRTARSAPNSPSNRSPQSASSTSKTDQASISGAARELAGAIEAERPPEGTLTPERLRQIRDRIASGFYEKPEIWSRMATDLANALDRPLTQGRQE